MSLNPVALAEEMKEALGHGDQPTSPETVGLAAAIVAHIQTGVVSHAVPGSVTGETASGGNISNGAASGGKILLVPQTLAQLMSSSFPPTPEVQGFAVGMSTHILTAGQVDFPTGTITGPCASTGSNPGPLAGLGANGKIQNLDPSDMAKLIATGIGKDYVSDVLQKMCEAVVDHIEKNASVSYLPGTVTGTCPAGGGPLELGVAAAGVIL